MARSLDSRIVMTNRLGHLHLVRQTNLRSMLLNLLPQISMQLLHLQMAGNDHRLNELSHHNLLQLLRPLRLVASGRHHKNNGLVTTVFRQRLSMVKRKDEGQVGSQMDIERASTPNHLQTTSRKRQPTIPARTPNSTSSNSSLILSLSLNNLNMACQCRNNSRLLR